MKTKQSGQLAEEYIAQQLVSEGYQIRARNYHKHFGEIDIIAQKDQTLAFVEVKFRTSPLFDMGTIITKSKQKKIIATAKYFLAAHSLDRYTVQFDVAFVVKKGNTFSTEYIANAFQE